MVGMDKEGLRIEDVKKFLGELNNLVFLEKGDGHLLELDKDVYAEAEVIVSFLREKATELAVSGDMDYLQQVLTYLNELNNAIFRFNGIRYEKICRTARLRPNSDVIRARLVSWEVELYDFLSSIVEKHLSRR